MSELTFKKRENSDKITFKNRHEVTFRIRDKNDDTTKDKTPKEKKPTTKYKYNTNVIDKPIKLNNTLVFVDASYFIFYRYSATKAWWQHSKQGTDADCHINNETFVEKYSNHFSSWVEKIASNFKTDRIYWFKDCPRSQIWRMSFYSDYKSNRDKIAPNEIGPFFQYSFENLIPTDKVISVPSAEADDNAAISARYQSTNYPETKIHIITADTDYLQLVTDKIRIIKLPKFEEIPLEYKSGKDKIKVSPETYLEIKILSGDKSDQIPPVFSGCGPKTAHDISSDKEAFKSMVVDYPDRLIRYQHNKRLISFDSIPDDLKNQIIKSYKSVVYNQH